MAGKWKARRGGAGLWGDCVVVSRRVGNSRSDYLPLAVVDKGVLLLSYLLWGLINKSIFDLVCQIC